MPTISVRDISGLVKRARQKSKKRNGQAGGSKRTPAPRGLGLALGSLRTAPAAVSVSQPARFLSYGNVAGPNGSRGMLYKGTMPFCPIVADGASGAGLSIGGSNVGHIQLSAVMAGTLSPQVARIASCFTRYRFRKLRFTYNAMGSTASGVRMAIAYTDDPFQPTLSAVTGSSGFASLLMTPNSTTFSPWTSFSIDVPCGQDYAYTYFDNTWITDSAKTRQSKVGCLSCVSDSLPGVTFSYGILWWSFELELIDEMPLVTAPALESKEHSAVPNEENLQEMKANPNLGVLTVSAYSLGSAPPLVRTDADYVRVEGRDGDTRSQSGRSGEKPASLPVSRK